MTEGAGLNFSFQGEGLVIPPKPDRCNGCDERSNALPVPYEMRAYKVVFSDNADLGTTREAKVQVAWWCDDCVQYAPMQEEIFESITRIAMDGVTEKVIFAEGQWHLE